MTDDEPTFYMLSEDGRTAIPTDVLAWGRSFDDFPGRLVASDTVGDTRVMTIFTGFRPYPGQPPILWTTGTFGPMGTIESHHKTREEAEAWHRAVVDGLRARGA